MYQLANVLYFSRTAGQATDQRFPSLFQTLQVSLFVDSLLQTLQVSLFVDSLFQTLQVGLFVDSNSWRLLQPLHLSSILAHIQ